MRSFISNGPLSPPNPAVKKLMEWKKPPVDPHQQNVQVDILYFIKYGVDTYSMSILILPLKLPLKFSV